VTLVSKPSYIAEPEHGLKGAAVGFTVEGATSAAFNKDAVKALDRALGAWEEPEFETPQTSPLDGRARQVLRWVYRACLAAKWPVFQVGVFQPERGSDLNGQYYLPTRVGPRWLPARLFKHLLEDGLLAPTKQFDQARFLEQVAQFQEALKQHGLKGLNQRIILRFIHDRDAPVTEVDKSGTFMVGKGEKFRLFRGSLSETTGELTVKLLMSKKLTCDILRDANIPTTDPQFVYGPQDILDFAAENSHPIVLKPNNTNGNIAIYANIIDESYLRSLLDRINLNEYDFIVEKHFFGESYRVCLFDGEIIFIHQKYRPRLFGDGSSNIRSLLKTFCEDTEPGENFTKPRPIFKNMMRSPVFNANLERAGLTYDSVLEKDQVFFIHQQNGTFGHTNYYVTEDDLPEQVRQVVQKIMKIFDIQEGSIDFISEDLLVEDPDFVINEVNTSPAFTYNVEPLRQMANMIVDSIQ